MEQPTDPTHGAAESAAKWNHELARRVTRWKRLRLTLATVLTAIGTATAFSGSASIWSVPSFLAAFVAYLLYLDSRDQLREVKARRWNTLTPRTARITAPKRQDAPKATS